MFRIKLLWVYLTTPSNVNTRICPLILLTKQLSIPINQATSKTYDLEKNKSKSRLHSKFVARHNKRVRLENKTRPSFT